MVGSWWLVVGSWLDFCFNEGMRIERFEEIEGWKLARELTQKVYEITKQGEFAKDFWPERSNSKSFRIGYA